ncbi:MAG: TonB-dependent receptor [Pseudomonadota bacterium]
MAMNSYGIRRPLSAFCVCTVLLSLGLPSPARSDGAGAGAGQLADLGLEQLLGLDIYAASRFPQPLAEAPSSITVVTAEDIRQFGYRSLSDVLRSMPGLHVSSDRVYEYLGVRGIRRVGDFNAPVLLLIDGHRQNDNVYEAAAIGHELPVPIELIERVEFVRGPGSSVFGSNALLGTINVVTRAPSRTTGLRAVTEVGTASLSSAYLQFDTPLLAQSALQLSAKYGRRAGEHLEVASSEGLLALNHLDDEEFVDVTAKLVSGAWTLQGVHGQRLKQIPLPIYGADAGSANNKYFDSSGFVSLGYESTLGGSDWLLQGQLLHGHYQYRGELAYEGVINLDRAQGRWLIGELSAVYRGFINHQLLVGVDGQNDYRQRQSNVDVEPYTLYQDSRRRESHVGIYAQDDWRLGSRLSLNIGLRHDSYSDFKARTTPRVALIVKPAAGQVVKLIYGQAYRVPSNYERFYEVDLDANPDLRPEVASNWDLIWENRVNDSLRLQLAAQLLSIDHFIIQAPGDQQFSNRGEVEAQGLDLVVDKHWAGGLQSRASFSLQRTEDADSDLDDAPRWLAKFHGSLPIRGSCRLGLEALGTGQRNTAGVPAESYWLLNLTLAGVRLRPGLELGFSVDNLLDESYVHPGSPDLSDVGIDAVPAEGRQFRLRLGLAL